MKIVKKIFLALLIIFALMQIFRIDKSTPKVEASDDFIAMTKPDSVIANQLRTSCYDCHSYETKYPWYSNMAPVSWFLKNHINEARIQLNFSEWKKNSVKQASLKIGKIYSEIDEGGMPLSSYTLIHTKAKINAENKKLIMEWLEVLDSLGN